MKKLRLWARRFCKSEFNAKIMTCQNIIVNSLIVNWKQEILLSENFVWKYVRIKWDKGGYREK